VKRRYDMKVRINYGVVALCAILLLSCGTALKEIALKSQSERTDVFQEVQERVSIPRGFVELTITSSVKTHLEGHYILESKESAHGKSAYPFVINIDGQAATWKVNGQEENLPMYDERGKGTPEGGKGVRYNLEKKILLRTGTHNIFFGLPGEKLSLQFKLVLKPGDSNVLEFRPVYSRRGKQPRYFFNGVSRLEVILNGNEIKIS